MVLIVSYLIFMFPGNGTYGCWRTCASKWLFADFF